MTDKSVIENRVSATLKYLKILERYKGYSKEGIETDVDIRGAVERYLYLAVQSAIDLAEAVVAGRGYRKPSTMAETFRILEEEGVIPPEVAERMARMTGFRNIIAHDYGDIDYDIVYDILRNGLGDIRGFLAVVEKLR